MSANHFMVTSPIDLTPPVCLTLFLFAYNVSRQMIYYKRLDDNSRIVSSTLRNTGNRVRASNQYSSVYAWLTDFSKYFLLSPDSRDIYLPFRRRSMVYQLYLKAIEADNGKLNIYHFLCQGIQKLIYSKYICTNTNPRFYC
jgi:hypothetical protein